MTRENGNKRTLMWAIGTILVLLLSAGGIATTNYSMHTTDREKIAELKETTNRKLDDHERRLKWLEQRIQANQAEILERLKEIKAEMK